MKNHFFAIFCVLLVGSLMFRAALFAVSAHNLPVSSDESLTVLQAKQIRAGRTPIFFMGQPYLFPAESYIHAPFVNILPRTPFGARLIAFLMGLAGIAATLAILRRLYPSRARWPGVLLALFPSTYLQIHQSAYAMPGYPTLLLCSSLCILLALHARRQPWLALLSGLTAGVGFSTHMLILPAALAAAYICFSGIQTADGATPATGASDPADAAHPPRSTRGRGATAASFLMFALGTAIGLAPWFAATILYHGEHGTVLQSLAIPDAIRRVWSPIIRYTMPAAMGIAPVPFPDETELNLWPRAELIFVWAWTMLVAGGVLMIMAATGAAAARWRAGQPARRKTMATGMASAPFYAIILLNLVIFAVSRRADSGSFRYLLPAVWCFPFVIQHWFDAGPRRLRPVIGGLAILLAGYNIASAAHLTRLWQTENFAAKYASLPDLQPALDYLKSNNIRHCVASYGAAYRINFMTDEAIICSQPFNERFPWWPVPYKETVDAATNVAYVLTPRIRFLQPDVFARHLRVMHIAAQNKICGDFQVYHNFRPIPQNPPQTRIPPADMTISASHNDGAAARLTAGGAANTGWASGIPQQEGMWLEIRLREPRPVGGVRLIQHYAEKFTPATLDVFTLHAGEWQPALLDAEPGWDKFIFRNGHPVYGSEPRTLEWPPIVTDGLRLRIRRPYTTHPWAIDTLELCQADRM